MGKNETHSATEYLYKVKQKGIRRGQNAFHICNKKYTVQHSIKGVVKNQSPGNKMKTKISYHIMANIKMVKRCKINTSNKQCDDQQKKDENTNNGP